MDVLFLILGIVMTIIKANHYLIIPDFLIWICFGMFLYCFIRGCLIFHQTKKHF
mgnify:CR=1 FL=1